MKRFHPAWLGLLVLCATTPLPAQTFCNNAAITIPDAGSATPYPSTIAVTGAATPVSITLTINGLSHASPRDIDLLLVGPLGQKMIVQGDAGGDGSSRASGVSYTLSDAGETALPSTAGIAPRAYRPTSFDVAGTFAPPAPAGPYAQAAPAGSATLRSTFGGANPNGNWSLYAVDDNAGGSGQIAQGWCLNLAGASALSPLRISELRVRGPFGSKDEFIELMNVSDRILTIAAIDGSAGLGVYASDGNQRCTISNGTIIPAYGHFLCTNGLGYSLGGYPSGGGTTAFGDAVYTTDIADNSGVAVFASANMVNATLANRIDAVGSTIEVNALYKEGTGYPGLSPFSVDYAWVRDDCGKRANLASVALCANHGVPGDSDDNATDFYFVDTAFNNAGAGQRLGAPGPQNLASPTAGRSGIPSTVLDGCVTRNAAPNLVRDLTSDPLNYANLGTLDLRRSYTNDTAAPLTQLRFRLIDVTTFPAASHIAELRPRSSPDIQVAVDQPPCGDSANLTVFGTTREEPPTQDYGGGFNSSFSVPSISDATPFAVGSTINVHFLFGVQQAGLYRVDLVPEAIPAGGGPDPNLIGCTDSPTNCSEFIFRDDFES